MSDDELDIVFVALNHWDLAANLVLEWAISHFENDKTKFIITTARYVTERRFFLMNAENEYLPRCRKEKIPAEIHAPQAGMQAAQIVLDLITKHGMKKLVMATEFEREVSQYYKNPNLSCQIWFFDRLAKKLGFIRRIGPDPLQKARIEFDEFRKRANEETMKRKNIEEQMLLKTEQAKRDAQTIDRLQEQARRNEQDIARLREQTKTNEQEINRLRQKTERAKTNEEEIVRLREKAKTNEQEIVRLCQDIERAKLNEQRIDRLCEQAKPNEQVINSTLHETEQTKMNEQEISRLRQENEQLKQNMALSTYITFQELEQATQNFSDLLKIGEGSVGSVYKGTFRGTTVAIKKFMSQNKQGLSMFQQEVVILSTVRHPNLVTLIGVCAEPPALVYEFLSNGSLHNYMTHGDNNASLTWQIRTRIINEICSALIFLHSNKPIPIIHGDLKPDGIFLDANFTSKLSDFGLIKLGETDNTTKFRPTDAKTFAYIDPEFLITGEMTSESDVYSFGIIILHLLTGKSPLNIRKIVEESMGTDTFRTMVDVSAGRWPSHHAEEMAKIGIRCADVSRSKRPDLVNEVWPIIESLMKFP